MPLCTQCVSSECSESRESSVNSVCAVRIVSSDSSLSYLGRESKVSGGSSVLTLKSGERGENLTKGLITYFVIRNGCITDHIPPGHLMSAPNK